MSELSDGIASLHLVALKACTCGHRWLDPDVAYVIGVEHPRHVAEVTETAVRKQVAQKMLRRAIDEGWGIRTVTVLNAELRSARGGDL